MRTEEDYRKALETAVRAVHKEEGKNALPNAEAIARIKSHIEHNFMEASGLVDAGFNEKEPAKVSSDALIAFWKWAAGEEYGLKLLRKLRKKDAVEEHEERLKAARPKPYSSRPARRRR